MRGHGSPHIDLIEGGEHCVSVLSLFQSLSYPLTHPVHFHLGSCEGVWPSDPWGWGEENSLSSQTW